MSRNDEIQAVEIERQYLEECLTNLIEQLGPIPIASEELMPYGWRKAAKGRTVWRILEEIISQNLEKNANNYGFDYAEPAESEVGVYDFRFEYNGGKESYVNIKSAVEGGRRNKDDLSKAEGLRQFFEEQPNANLYVASFIIRFNDNMTIEIVACHVFPYTWIPDIYVNPSNNGNLQSAYYKDISDAIKRTNEEFFEEFLEALEIANEKRRKKRNA
jgi:hypothetical protein